MQNPLVYEHVSSQEAARRVATRDSSHVILIDEEGRIWIPDGSGKYSSARAARSLYASPLRVALLGDSITEGSAYNVPVGTEYQRALGVWDKDLALTMPNLNSAGTFARTVFANGACGVNDSVVIEFDGIESLRTNVAGEGFGPWVSVRGGGFFHVLSSGGTKGIFAQMRWNAAGRPSGAVFDTIANGGVRRVGLCTFAGAFHGALMRRGYADIDLRNFGIGGDTTKHILSRVQQVVDFGPDLTLYCAGINNYADANEIQDVIDTIKALNAGGSYVVVGTTMPAGNNNPTEQQARQQADLVNRLLRLRQRDELQCEVVNLFNPLANPFGTSGAALVNPDFFGADLIHVNINAVTTRLADAAAPHINRLLPPNIATVSTAANAYHATDNPQGNLFGAAGVFAGTGGGAGSNPAATGTIAANWTTNPGSGAFASVSAVAPADASPIARDDGAGGAWQRFVCAGAGAGGAERVFFCNMANPDFTPGKLVRVRLTMRLRNATLLTLVDPAFYILNNAGSAVTKMMLATDGNGTDMVSGTLVDSQTLYLTTPWTVIPPEVKTTGTVGFLQIGMRCGQGGGFTMDLADAVCEIKALG